MGLSNQPFVLLLTPPNSRILEKVLQVLQSFFAQNFYNKQLCCRFPAGLPLIFPQTLFLGLRLRPPNMKYVSARRFLFLKYAMRTEMECFGTVSIHRKAVSPLRMSQNLKSRAGISVSRGIFLCFLFLCAACQFFRTRAGWLAFPSAHRFQEYLLCSAHQFQKAQMPSRQPCADGTRCCPVGNASSQSHSGPVLCSSARPSRLAKFFFQQRSTSVQSALLCR